MAVGEIGESSSEEVSLFDGGSVAVRAEELVSEGQDHKLLHKFVTHHELFGGARNIPVVVHDSHSCETSDLHLESEVVLHVDVDGRLFGAERAGWVRSLKVLRETLVSNLVDHDSQFLLIIKSI